jgi:hypothetical protein
MKSTFDIHKSVHHHTIQIIQPTRCISFTSLLLDVYVWLNMFWTSPRPSSGAGHWPDHDQQCSNRFSPTVKPEAPSAVVCSWWWVGRRPKHVEPHKRQVINLWNCCILLVELFELDESDLDSKKFKHLQRFFTSPSKVYSVVCFVPN